MNAEDAQLWLQHAAPRLTYEGPGDHAALVLDTLRAGDIAPTWGIVDAQDVFHPAAAPKTSRRSMMPLVLAALVLGLGAFIAVQMTRAPSQTAIAPIAKAKAADSIDVAGGAVSEAAGTATASEAAAPETLPPRPMTDDERAQARLKALNATVHIKAGDALGAGVIVSRAGHVLTNAHVVNTTELVTVQMHQGRTRQAKVIARDVDSDLAVVKVLKVLPTETFAPAPIGRVADLALGDTVHAMGSPLGLPFSVATGELAQIAHRIDGIPYLQLSLRTFPGNSGGPLFDHDFRLVGLVTLAVAGPRGFGFAHRIEGATQGDSAILRPYLDARARDAELEALWIERRDDATDLSITGYRLEHLDGLMFRPRFRRATFDFKRHRRCPSRVPYCAEDYEAVFQQLYRAVGGSQPPTNVALVAAGARGERGVIAYAKTVKARDVSLSKLMSFRMRSKLRRLKKKGVVFRVRSIRARFDGSEIYRTFNANTRLRRDRAQVRVLGTLSPAFPLSP